MQNTNQLNNFGLPYSLSGRKENPAVLLLHGFMGSINDWKDIVPLLSKKYYCIVVDLPGHGEQINLNQLDDTWSFETFSNRIFTLLDQLKIKTTALVGYSMGGRIALYFALKYPVKISHLVLESTSPGIENKVERETRLKDDLKLSKILHIEPFTTFLSNWYALPVFKGIKNHPQYKDLLENRKKNNPKLLAKALCSFSPGLQPYFGHRLKELPIPVNLICGEKDSKYLKQTQELIRNYPDLSIKIFKECGHNVHFEKPDLFAEHLLKFLSL